ncbi:hypothetical protein Trydic_g1862 [Trypoxylus dichotomus]
MVVKETTKQCKDKSQDWWKNVSGQRQTKKFLIGYMPFTADLLSRDRETVRIIVGLLTGHCILRKHMSNLGLTERHVDSVRRMGSEYPKAKTYVGMTSLRRFTRLLGLVKKAKLT